MLKASNQRNNHVASPATLIRIPPIVNESLRHKVNANYK